MLSDVGRTVGDRLGRGGIAVRVLRPAYGAFLRAVYGRRGLPWRVNGEPLRIDPAVRHLIPQHNEPTLFEFLREGVRPGDLVLDIGAFLGTYALMEARWAGERGRVVAFEPTPFSFSILKRHVRMNGLGAERVDARRAAVGASCGRSQLMTFDDEPYRNQMADHSSPHHVTVETVTVDSVTAELGRPPDWIRMDVQGLEFQVLEGARETIRAAAGRMKIVVETHPDQWPDFGVRPREANDRFAAMGLRARPIARDEPLFVQSSHVVLGPL